MSGYGYGIWLDANNFPKPMKHIPHITLVCNILTESKGICLWRKLKEQFPQPIKIRILPKAHIFESTYSENDMYTKCWGYYCEVVDFPQSKLDFAVKSTMQEYCISGSSSSRLHITMGYENIDKLEDLQSVIELECQIVVANILNTCENWYIL